MNVGVEPLFILKRLFRNAVLIVSLIYSSTAWGDNRFADIYLGSLSAPGSTIVNDSIGIFLDDSGTAVITTAVRIIPFSSGGDPSTDVEFINKKVSVKSNGSFAVANIDGKGTSFSGQFGASGVNGNFSTANGIEGTFSAPRSDRNGFLRSSAGFYEGPLSGILRLDGKVVRNFSGTFSAIIDSNGEGYAFDSSQLRGDGLTVSEDNTVEVFFSSGLTDFTGSLDTSAKVASGTFLSVDIGGLQQSGTWSASRIAPLPNTAPVAVADNYEARQGLLLAVSAAEGVLKNDSDPNEDPITASLASDVVNGVLDLNPNGGFNYQPNKGFFGVDEFTYRADDGLGQSPPTTVTIIVGRNSSTAALMLLLGEP